MAKLYHINNLNCYDAHKRKMQPGDELHYGTALGPEEVKYSHTWIVRGSMVVDLFNWTEHEDQGVWEL